MVFHYPYTFRPLQGRLKTSVRNDFGFLPLTCANWVVSNFINRISQIDYTITDGYDYAQLAICFLYQFKGKYVDDVWGKDRKGKLISIRTACFRKVDSELLHFRRKIAHNRQMDFGHNKHDIADPRDCFEDKTEDYAKADKLLNDLHLTEITVFGVKYRKLRIGRNITLTKKHC